jgi:lysophospholipid acyltransferase (LPLAT)-like uncharacterized protein
MPDRRAVQLLGRTAAQERIVHKLLRRCQGGFDFFFAPRIDQWQAVILSVAKNPDSTVHLIVILSVAKNPDSTGRRLAAPREPDGGKLERRISMTTQETQPDSERAEVAPKPSRRPAIVGFFAWAIARLIGMTLRIRYENFGRIQEIVDQHHGAILVSWHGRTLVPANIFRHRGYWALISLSRDGEIQDHIFRRFGYRTIRGSSGRGGVRAALQLAKKISEGGVLAFTPDGPRGPTHKVQQGTIFLAQRSGRPIIPLGISARPRKLLPTWDSYMIPYPFARGAFVVGEPIFVPSDLDDAGKERVAEQLEEAINTCESRAEALLGLV